MFAVRNLKLCTKDCTCLYVCPTGATATEDGSIDTSKCLDGCRLCVDACPSHAIYLVYTNYPERPLAPAELMAGIASLLAEKAEAWVRLTALAENEPDAQVKRLLTALARSAQILGQDQVRAAGYLIPEAKRLQTFVPPTLSGKGGTDVAIEEIVLALERNMDAPERSVAVCAACGALVLDGTSESCAQCGGELIEM
jgi:ferredoxin